MNKDVFRLDIAVDDVAILQVFECYDNLCDKSADYLIWKALFVLENEVLQSAFVAVLNK
jgi:hypothetical protein